MNKHRLYRKSKKIQGFLKVLLPKVMNKLNEIFSMKMKGAGLKIIPK